MATMHAQLQAKPAVHAAERPEVADAQSARAASMRMQAVRECGRVVDFIVQSASSTAAQLLRCEATALPGQRLCVVLAAVNPNGHPVLINRYRRVLEHGRARSFSQVHVVDDRQEIVIHRVVPEGDGVSVTLTNLSADRRAQIERLQARTFLVGEPP